MNTPTTGTTKPVYETVTLTDPEDRETTFKGKLLGLATSESDFHSNHQGDFAAKREKCSACRWFEVMIYKRLTERHDHNYDVDYVIQTIGHSDVPGEQTYGFVKTTDSAFEVVEILTVRRPNSTFIPAQSARALAQAAQVDDDLREAYVNRAVI